MAALLQVNDLVIEFGQGTAASRAVDGISFSIASGKTLAIVGESGSGKSVTALSLTRLLASPPARYPRGSILWEGQEILTLSPQRLQAIRGKEIAYVFQEPSTSLNPVFQVGFQIAEAIRLHRPEVEDVQAEVVGALREVGITNPEQRAHAYPHELSGGMQQRVMIAMALSCRPKLLVADEPTTALDVTIQAQIMALLRDLKDRKGMSILLITHNFGIVKGFADEVAVMFRGKIVEAGPATKVLENPQHPYTQALIGCVPRLGQKARRLTTIDYASL
jgi:peptide/nickel transport system ATP-binding protein/oligopeptide transport system ATP-binding protein